MSTSVARSADVRVVARKVSHRVSTLRLSRLRSLRHFVPALVIGAAIAGSTAMSYYFARDLYFGGDDWDFLLHRGTVSGADDGMWLPHYGHWSTGVVLVYRFLFSLAGMNYLPYVAVCWALHAGNVVVSYHLVRRAGAGTAVGLVVAWLVAFMGAGAEALLWATVMNLLASTLLGLVALLVYVVLGDVPRARLAAWLLLIVSLSFSGAGVSMVALVATYVALRHSFRAGLALVSVPALAFGIWWLLIGRTDMPVTISSRGDYLKIPEFFWTGLSHALGTMSGVPETGGVLLVLLIVLPLVARGAPETMRILAAAGVVGALFQMLAATTRVSAGLDWATSGRYAYLTIIMLVPSLALCLTLLARALVVAWWIPAIIVTITLIFYTLNAATLMRIYDEDQTPFRTPWKDRIAGLVAAADADEAVLTDQLDPGLNPYLRASLLLTPEGRAAVVGKATEQGRIDAESLSMVSVGPQTAWLGAPSTVRLALGFEGTIHAEPGCHRYSAPAGGTPALELDTGPNGNEIIVYSPSTKVRTQLVRAEAESVPREWTVEPGSPVHVASSARNAMMRITFDQTGSYTICRQ
ncbi:hypothetical protein [Nocardioides sp. YIM 152315]|uniref:hypothetical protein n=1 Tax=Nocardioides sp. YIM 152315 TaxID=3031760 RepID=UPI0023DBDCEB|nr:hypothetical protein [Nocardioides sp. YIM 152315]MDF1603142.1 hypothetical protein [Nocardioides sp. YIM 152315]